MLQSVPFPHAGSSALLAGQPVKIHQWNRDGSAVVITDRGTRRAQPDELSPPAEPTLFERWLADRVVPRLHAANLDIDEQARTPATDVLSDYMNWLSANGGHAEDYPTSEYAFRRMMLEKGHRIVRGFWRRTGDTHARSRILFKLALKTVL
jgi:hypothetical protein